MGWDDEVYQRIKDVVDLVVETWNSLVPWTGIISIVSNIKALIGVFAEALQPTRHE